MEKLKLQQHEDPSTKEVKNKSGEIKQGDIFVDGKETRRHQETQKNHLEGAENEEAFGKIVDPLSTEDLKYKDVGDNRNIESILESGILTPITFENVPTEGTKITHTNIKNIRTRIQERDKLVREHSAGGKMTRKYIKSGNVYYPEGRLKQIRDHLLDTHTVDDVGEKDPYNDGSRLLVDPSGLLFNAIMSYHPILRREFEEKGITKESITGESSMENRLGEYKAILKREINSEGGWDNIRKVWLKAFFAHVEFMPKSERPMQETGYPIHFGVVINPEVEVKLSHSIDFPTEAVIWQPRVKPKEIIGIIINTNKEHFFGNVARPINLQSESPSFYSSGDYIDKDTVFYMPQETYAYLYSSKYKESFLNFLKKEGPKKVSNLVEQLLIRLDEFERGTDGKFKYRSLDEILEFTEQFIGEKMFKRFNEYAKKFIEEKSEFKDGETVWSGIVRLAKKYQIPIYNTDGEVLWPIKS